MNKMIENPILRGFNPDPDIIRVDDTYYVVTSTFEWFPGYQIHKSKDLKNWQFVSHPLNRVSQLDMKGIPDSGGVWAPCISYNPFTGLYYLPYTNVRRFDGATIDCPNYLVTAADIEGEWSEPVYLGASGFDGSFFHDDDGKSFYLSMIVDHRSDNMFGGIVIQEFDNNQQKLVGKQHRIFGNSEHGCTEGPHLYKRNGYYYLLLAEGGTSYNHCISLARSRDILGPYELHPDNPVLTAKYSPDNYLQKSGHGGLVETPDGDWYLTFLTGRPLTKLGKCILGREAGIEKVEWRENDWLYTVSGDKAPRRFVEAPMVEQHEVVRVSTRLEFESPEISPQLQSLRVPMTKNWINQTDRSGYLRLYGRESLCSKFEQSLAARRVQAHHTVTETCIEFEPVTYQQLAGLTCFYNTYTYHYLYICGSDYGKQKFINIITGNNHHVEEPLQQGIEITGAKKVWLKADFDGAQLQFYFALEKGQWRKIGPVLDGSILSDEHVEGGQGPFRPCFTGAFVGMACQDLSGRRQHADFEYFDYKEVSHD